MRSKFRTGLLKIGAAFPRLPSGAFLPVLYVIACHTTPAHKNSRDIIASPRISCACSKTGDSSQPGVFAKVETEAQYSGNWNTYLNDHLIIPEAVQRQSGQENHIAIVRFIVAINGTVSDIRLIKDPGNGMGAEAIRLIEQSGKWKPALLHNMPVKAYRKQPITFRIARPIVENP